MAGIYIHIPFCRKICHYCDFYRTTDISSKLALLDGLKKELVLRKKEFSEERIETIYLGGGTPSLLKSYELQDLFNTVKSNYNLVENAEITLEANPDDINPSYLSEIITIGFNRLSIGIQSFNDSDLKLMNRRHSASQALSAIDRTKESGIKNISIDLIYGLPNLNMDQWMKNIQTAISMDVQHISAYHLTYHQGTVFHEKLKRGVLKELSDEASLKQFEKLISMLKENGFIHYEISNFSKDGYFSQHNSAYWKNKKYMGIGPSAHSYSIDKRRWNVSDINKYIENINTEEKYWEEEVLSIQDKFNDYIITNLRTIWGISTDFIQKEFPNHYACHIREAIQKYLEDNYIKLDNGIVTLTTKGLFLSDKIMTDLMFVE